MTVATNSRTIPSAERTAEAVLIHHRLAARRETLTAIDSFVRPMIAERLRMSPAAATSSIDLTVYDEVFRRSSAGGHWSVTSRMFGFLSHRIGTYAVTLHFDGRDRPTHFVISGERDVTTESATPESLSQGLEQALRSGPLVTWAPNFPPGVSF
jgi:hypothetical protein